MGAFEAHVAVGVDEGGDDVGIEGVGADADGVAGVDAGLAAEVFLFHDKGATHAAGFADVELVREISVVGKLVLGPAPRGEFLADGSGDAGVVGEGPEHTEGVVAVQLGEAGALGVLFYGSNLRTGSLEGVLDFYVLLPGPQRERIWPRVSYREWPRAETDGADAPETARST